MLIKHSKLNVQAELTDFSQSQFEIYHSKLIEYAGNSPSVAVASGAVVKAALDAGFLKGIKDVGGMQPKAVLWITKKIHEHVVEITSIPDDDPN